MKRKDFPSWIGKLFLFLAVNYAFFDKAAKEDEDKAIALKTIWFQKLGRYSEKEIFSAFDDVITHYKSKLRDPTAAEYEEIILNRRRKIREQRAERERHEEEKKLLARPPEEIEHARNVGRYYCQKILKMLSENLSGIGED